MTDTSQTSPPAVAVPVKSAWWSKINWSVVIMVIASFASIWGIDISEEVQKAIVSAIVAVGGLVIIVTKTYFTKSVTPQAVDMAKSSTITKSAPLPPATPSQVDALVRVGELPKGTTQ